MNIHHVIFAYIHQRWSYIHLYSPIKKTSRIPGFLKLPRHVAFCRHWPWSNLHRWVPRWPSWRSRRDECEPWNHHWKNGNPMVNPMVKMSESYGKNGKSYGNLFYMVIGTYGKERESFLSWILFSWREPMVKMSESCFIAGELAWSHILGVIDIVPLMGSYHKYPDPWLL